MARLNVLLSHPLKRKARIASILARPPANTAQHSTWTFSTFIRQIIDDVSQGIIDAASAEDVERATKEVDR